MNNSNTNNNNNNNTTTPLRDAMRLANIRWHLLAIEARATGWMDSSDAAEVAYLDARAALAASDELRKWTARIMGGEGGEWQFEARSLAEARKTATKWALEGDWDGVTSPISVQVDVEGEDGQEEAWTVFIDPPRVYLKRGKKNTEGAQ